MNEIKILNHLLFVDSRTLSPTESLGFLQPTRSGSKRSPLKSGKLTVMESYLGANFVIKVSSR